MSQKTQRSLTAKWRRAPSISSRTKSGTIGIAMSCECGCSSVAPAAAPWFLKIRMCFRRMSRCRSSIRSRYPHNTCTISGSDMSASVRSCCGVSMITSWAPMPFMRSYMPSPVRSKVPSTCSAGYLLGTTRTSHPGPLGAPPFWRYAITSGGVIASWPGQNGQCSRPTIAARSKWKSWGRCWRSVEMITQRPVTGSLRSCGIECVLHDLDRGLAGVDANRDDVEAARDAGEAMPHHIVDGGLGDAPLLERRHRVVAVAEFVAVARLHLDEDDRRAVARDDVQFSPAATVAAGKNCVPAAFELGDGEIFAQFSKARTGVGHGDAGQQEAHQVGVARRAVGTWYVPGTYLARTWYLPGTGTFDLAQRVVQDLHRHVRLLARQHERRREPDRVLSRPEDQQSAPECRLDDRVALRRRALLGPAIAHELDADHQPSTPNVADQRMRVGDRLQRREQMRADRRRVGDQFVLQQLDRRNRRRARHRVAAE